MNEICNILGAAGTDETFLALARQFIIAVYTPLLVLVCIFGFHRWLLVFLYCRHVRKAPQRQASFRELPRVTVQLPMFNERYVAERIIRAACAIDYPRDRLQIQVLDDSTDDTQDIAQRIVQEYAEQGVDIQYLHRTDRTGFKAGALEEGLKQAGGDFVAIFDADFVPPRDILQSTIHYFTDDKVGMVQTRWEHLNRNDSLLTRMQAILLDAHFMVEQIARNRSGRFMNFNGTAGVWRRVCIEDGGGWQHDTLTEDLDLSYRCQMKKWRFVFLPHITAPAELPPEILGFKQQQFRWTKGHIQTAKKLLPVVLRSPDLGWRVKLEALFHLCCPIAYLCASVLVLLMAPAALVKFHLFGEHGILQAIGDLMLFLLATCAASVFYLFSQRELFARWIDRVKYLPLLMALAMGMAINNSRAVLEALFGKESAFERTPKFGMSPQGKASDWLKKIAGFGGKGSFILIIELLYGAYMIAFCVFCLIYGKSLLYSLPFAAIFAFGYLYVAVLSIHSSQMARVG